MNIMQMMQQAQKMQKKLQEAQEELSKMEIAESGADGAIEVIVDGQGKIKGIKLDPKALNPENPESVDKDALEMLEDLILETVKSAQVSAANKMEAKMKSVTGGVSIPGLF